MELAAKRRWRTGALCAGLAGMKLKLLFEPGTSFSYSNMAYEVLGDLKVGAAEQKCYPCNDHSLARP